MKLPRKYYNTVLSCLAAVIISVPIAFLMVVINLGFVKGFGLAFIKSALVSILISIPLANIGIPLAQKMTDRIIQEE